MLSPAGAPEKGWPEKFSKLAKMHLWLSSSLSKVVILQSYSKYLTETLVFMWNGKSSISVFQEIFTSTDKIFFLGEGMSTRQ